MSNNTKAHNSIQQSLFLDIVVAVLFVGAMVLWAINKIFSLVLIVVAMYLLVTTLASVFYSRSRLFSGSSVESGSHGIRELRQALADYHAQQPSSLPKTFILPSMVFDSDTDSLSHPRDGGSVEVPLPPSIVVEEEDISDRELAAIGIRHLKDLADIDPEELASRLDLDASDAEDMVFRANLLYYGANITSLMDLAMMTPKEIILKIKNGPWRDVYSTEIDLSYLRELAEEWIDAAKVIMTRSLNDFFRGRMNQ